MFFRRSPPIDEGEVQRLRQAQEGLQQQLSQAREREAALAAELAQVRAELAGQRACLRPLQAFGQSFLDLQASLARMADGGASLRRAGCKPGMKSGLLSQRLARSARFIFLRRWKMKAKRALLRRFFKNILRFRWPPCRSKMEKSFFKLRMERAGFPRMRKFYLARITRI